MEWTWTPFFLFVKWIDNQRYTVTFAMSDNPKQYEPHPDPQGLTSKLSAEPKLDIDYEPYPERSVKIDADREKVLKSICNLYSGSASEEDMQVYAEKAVYDDPWSYCDTRYKIAGQWYGELS